MTAVSRARARVRARAAANFANFQLKRASTDSMGCCPSAVRSRSERIATHCRTPWRCVGFPTTKGGNVMRYILAGALALLMAGAAGAQTVDVRAGRLIDPASARVLTDQRIRIVGGRIASVAPWNAGDGPAAIDWSG